MREQELAKALLMRMHWYASYAWRLPCCRFDFPGAWGSLLSELAAAAAWDAPSTVPAKHRALAALKTIVRALSERPGGVIVPGGRPLLHQGKYLCQCR